MAVLFFRVGYMSNYNGPDEIQYGGRYPVTHGEAGEMWNFRAEDGYCYGYVMTSNFAGIDLSRLDNSHDWNSNDGIGGVDIVFFARRPQYGQVIIGWYRNATVFHKRYRARRGGQHDNWEQLKYVCEVNSENATLLPEEDRTYPVPRGKGFSGTSNVWYADAHNRDVAGFLRDVVGYIGRGDRQQPRNRSIRRERIPDRELIVRIEQAAVNSVWEYYKNMKPRYALKSVERDSCGWDLEASRNAENYRVCVVRNALDTPSLTILTPEKTEEGWFLVSDEAERVMLSESIAARASEVGG